MRNSKLLPNLNIICSANIHGLWIHRSTEHW